MAYATIADIRERGIDDPPSDYTVQQALDLATALVNARAGRSWGGSFTSYTVYDMRGDTAVIHAPFTSVTSVEVDGKTVDPDEYEVLPFGIRFHWKSWIDTLGRGVTVKVNATFPAAIPALAKEATMLLALDRLTGDNEVGGTVIPELPENVQSFSVEGLSVTRVSGASAISTTSTQRPSTGNYQADRLIDLIRPAGLRVV